MSNKHLEGLEEKFICINKKHVLNVLNGGELTQLTELISKVEKEFPNHEYICINTDEPYAEDVWEVVKEHNKQQIIAFIGRAGAGKSYQCNLLKEKGFVKLSFADALRDISFKSLGISNEFGTKYYDWLKDSEFLTVLLGNETHTLNFRKYLELLGTQGIRNYDNDFWCRCLIKNLQDNNYKKVCIDDMRFVNEYEYVKKFAEKNGYAFKVIFCDYRSDRYQENNEHESAKMGNYFATNEYKDLQEITFEDMQKYREA